MLKSIIKSLVFFFASPNVFLKIMHFFGKKGSLGFPIINIELWLRLLTKSGKGISFIHIGAHDGVENDPIYPYVEKYKWSGMLVEPVPFIFKKLKHNYLNVPNLQFENVGIADSDGILKFYHLPSQYKEPKWLQQIGSFDKQAIEFNLAEYPDLLPLITSTNIPTITLKNLIDRSKIKQVDLLLLDVEGLEWVILKQLENLSSLPKYLFFEWGCMNKNDLKDLFDYLVKTGYRCYQSGGDVLAVQ